MSDTKKQYEDDYAAGRKFAREHNDLPEPAIPRAALALATLGLSEAMRTDPLAGKSEAFKQGVKDEKTKD